MNRNFIGVTAFAILLSALDASAWDDDDADSNPFQRSNYYQQSSAIDYGYKNPYQSSIKNPRESVSRERGEKSIISLTSPQEAYEVSRRTIIQRECINTDPFNPPFA